MKDNKNKKAIKVLDLILIIIGISTFVFTVIMLILFVMFQAIPDTLCERFFTVIVGELGITGVIKIVKVICDNKTVETEINEIDDSNFDFKINNDEGVDTVG